VYIPGITRFVEMPVKAVVWVLLAVVACCAIAYAALELSPWPSALAYRWWMDHGGVEMNQALEEHVPPEVGARLDHQYDANDTDALLDVYFPESATKPLPTIVWVHGGGFLAGDRRQVGNYLRILAGRGYTTVAVGYSLGPASHYPTPLRQVNAALAYLERNAIQLRIDPEHLFLAGDSAGAHIAAQMANIVSSPEYAKTVGIEPAIQRAQLRGVILHCGLYDLSLAKFDGLYGHFMRTIVWSYSGVKEFGEKAWLPELSIPRNVTANFPPAFISVGNADPLRPHSRLLADALAKRGVKVDALFFPDDYRPALPHEYQFHLDTGAGREALDRTVRFLKATAY
jgi:acetyl esterase/lipase